MLHPSYPGNRSAKPGEQTIELPDGSVLMATYAGNEAEDGKMLQGIFRSGDRGATWAHLATLEAPFNLDEPHIAALPDGRLMTICRREGAIAWSDDLGKTWTTPVPLPFKLYDPWLLPLAVAEDLRHPVPREAGLLRPRAAVRTGLAG
jgi:hypothetical protein